MRILVTGASGMLGTAVERLFQNHDLVLTGRHELDVRNIRQVKSFVNHKLDLILHLAAETDLLRAEFDPTNAYLTNHTGSQNMVELARFANIPIVYIGTAGIFEGAKEIYTEKDKASPIHHYGRSKYYGEVAVRNYNKHYIIRSGWAMGGGPKIDKKFVNKVFKQLKGGVKILYGVKDVHGSPTYTPDFAKTVKSIVEAKAPYGTYNASGKGAASRYEVLKEFVRLLGLTEKIKIVPLTNAQYLKRFPSQYPRTGNEVLSIKKLEKTGLSAMRPWQEALAEYAEEFKEFCEV